MISDRIALIRNNINRVCQKNGRNPEEITLVAVTKFATVDAIKEAVAFGVTDIGENRVQAAREKFPLLSGLVHCQTNFLTMHKGGWGRSSPWPGGCSESEANAEGGLLRQAQDGERSRTIAPLAEVRSQYKNLSDGALPVRRHMIGHLQTNKVKLALELFDMIQSVGSFSLAEEIQKQAQRQDRVVDVLVQVDCAGEVQKFGVPKNEALSLIAKIQELPNIKIHGLMTIAPFVDDETVIRACFRDLKVLRDQVNQEFAGHERVTMKYLSMGMTHDYLIALEEGANMLRIGTAIFAEQ